jgi:hypothetical protein
MPRLSRGRLFALLVAACLLVSVSAVLGAVRRSDTGGAQRTSASARLPAAPSAPLVVFRSLDRGGRTTYGRAAWAPLDRPGARKATGLQCSRVHYAAGRGLCLAEGRRFPTPAYTAKIFGRDFRVRRSVKLSGVPSRARVSPDGRYGATTVFETGHSYADAGAFSTKTLIIDLARGRSLGDLEQFRVTMDGRRFGAVDFNFWGVTFAKDGNRFYATLASAGKTYLVQGDVAARALRVIHENVECPSLSPDNRRIAYKKLVGSSPARWRFHVLDLATMRETPLAETEPRDDQLEWLDSERVLYRVDETVRSVPADGSGKPRLFLRAADSPAVIRR